MVLHITLAKRQNRVQNSKINFYRYILMKESVLQTRISSSEFYKPVPSDF